MLADVGRCGLDAAKVDRFVEEAIYSLPGVEDEQRDIGVFITGSRAAALHQKDSDVNVNLVCSKAAFDRIGRQLADAGIVRTRENLFISIEPESAASYFGQRISQADISIICLDTLQKNLSEFNDEWMWVWQNAVRVADPGVRVEGLVEKYKFYPHDVLVRRIKYHWLRVGYWLLDVYPYPRGVESNAEILCAVNAILNAINEFMKVFLLAEDKCYPYQKHLSRVAASTRLGGKYCSLFKKYCTAIVSGQPDNTWERLDEIFEKLCCCDKSTEALALWDHCSNAMVSAGLSRNWAEADHDNINEMLMGQLG
ncbi:MAG: hypothetical protein KAS23_15900 [Anaerohalosphaera sp.]|nr:hypothetical protein [Anaerohalosphaera sp.]